MVAGSAGSGALDCGLFSHSPRPDVRYKVRCDGIWECCPSNLIFRRGKIADLLFRTMCITRHRRVVASLDAVIALNRLRPVEARAPSTTVLAQSGPSFRAIARQDGHFRFEIGWYSRCGEPV